MSWLSNMFKSQPNPADSAMPYFQQIPGEEHANYDPYIQRGQTAYDAMSPQFNQMSEDPSGFIASIMSKYSASPEFKYMNDYLTRGAANTAAAGGMRGSSQDVANEGDITQRLMSKDMQDYLENVLGAQRTGLQGEQNLYNTGYGASGELANALGTNLSNEGQLAFQGQREQNQRHNDVLSAILSALGTVGGAILGGPIGGAIGKRLFSGKSNSSSQSNSNDFSSDNSDLNWSGNF